VFRRICAQAWECGDPGLVFLDTINRDNPTPALGPLECTNPCGELPLLPHESCNLGSINLAGMVRTAGERAAIDYERLAAITRSAVRFLDDVIEVNRYPLPEIESVTRGNRKIGLGVMGWADMLSALGIPYASRQALTLADKVMGFIRSAGHRASTDLAAGRGAYPNSTPGGCGPSRRNATVTSIAPTGTISIIAGCSSGIEPHFALSFTRRHVLDGREIQEMHPGLLAELKRRGLDRHDVLEQVRRSGSLAAVDIPADVRSRFQTAFDVSPEWHVRVQAAFQRHSDNAVSKTVNLPCTASAEDVGDVFRLAHSLGCKGITVYRDRSRESQVLNIGCAACA
jgi:ribonucleoside-diphosphate reductase alpha chain